MKPEDYERAILAVDLNRIGMMSTGAMRNLLTKLGTDLSDLKMNIDNLEEVMNAEEQDIFESPTWRRPGTEQYFAEAREAGYHGVNKTTGEAYRLPETKPAEPEEHEWFEPRVDLDEGAELVMVKAYMPHVDALTDGARGPKLLLPYALSAACLTKPLYGDIVLLPPSDHGPAWGNVGMVVAMPPSVIKKRAALAPPGTIKTIQAVRVPDAYGICWESCILGGGVMAGPVINAAEQMTQEILRMEQEGTW